MKPPSPRKRTLSQPIPVERQIAEQVAPVSALPETVEGLIRERAYQLYEQRGCQDGSAQRDWLQAEQEILQQVTKAAA